MIDWTPVIGAAITAVGVVFGAWLAWRQKKLESVTEAEQVEADSHGKLIDQLQEEVTRLRDDLNSARSEITRLYDRQGALHSRLVEIETGARVLTAQLVENGQEPRWVFPPRWEPE